MKLKTTINGIEAEIEKSSIISGNNGTGKTSILSSVEIGIYGTHYGVRPKVKGEVEFESEYLEKAREYPLSDIINCRFLDLEPIKKKQILLNVIDTTPIKNKFGDYWKGDVISSIDNVKKLIKNVKDNLKSTETKIDIYSVQITNYKDRLEDYKEYYDTEFNFVNTTEIVKSIEKCKTGMANAKKEGKSLGKDICDYCGAKRTISETDKKNIEKLRAKYKLLKYDLEGYEVKLSEAEEYNNTGKQIQENIKLLAERNSLIDNIEDAENSIQIEVATLSELQSDKVLELEEYVKKGIYSEIGKQLSIDNFEIDLTKNFEIKFNGRDYKEMSRGQRYATNIYFSIGILNMLNCKIICIDDFEMVDNNTRKQIERDVKGFDYLIGIVSDSELTY